MSVRLELRTDTAGRLTASLDGTPVAGPIPLADLPELPALQAAPYDVGRALTQTLGGDALLARLEADADGVLLLEADEQAASIPWEFAGLQGRQLLACRYALLRLVDRPGDAAPAPDTLQFVVLGADPLVDEEGRAREGHRLGIDQELRGIRRVLQGSGIDLWARRVPPTGRGLQQALLRGPAVLHLTCHGDIVPTPDGPMAVLALEDADGAVGYLRGMDLVDLAPRGVLRLVVLSACRTAQGNEASLARALVQNGVPAAIGMQGEFPDPSSEDLATTLYRSLLAGQPLGEAVRQARLALSDSPEAAGLPVVYVARGGWGPLPLRDGVPDVRDLRLPGAVRLPTEVQAPRPLRGRDAELYGLARMYSQGTRVVTVMGSGGVGKTALAAAFAERFGWRWPQVLGISFASSDPNASRFRGDLLRGLLGDAAAQRLADALPGEQGRVLLEALRDWDGLLLLDNYESILQGLPEDSEALAIQRTVEQAAQGGCALLLTSRQQPAKLAGERVYPGSDRPLPGLEVPPAAELFLYHSSRAKDEKEAGLALAREVAQVTDGHPLALALLAGEYDESPVAAADFLAHWDEELRAAKDYGLAEHHRTFALAFERSLRRLPDPLPRRLRALSRFPFPFFAEGAALMWGLTAGEEGVASAREALAGLTRRNLLEVDGQFADGTPATYRFQPALRQAAAWCVPEDEHPALDAGYAAYGAWLAGRGYGDIHRDPGLARLVRLSMDALEAATDRLEGTERLRHIRWLAWLKDAYGQAGAAYELLTSVVAPGGPLPDGKQDPEAARAESSLRYELANVCVTRGDLDRALGLYQESLQLLEQIGDIRGKAASLHQMAQVYVTRGNLEGALGLYQESLQLNEQIGDIQGKAASLSMMAQVYVTRGDLDRALGLYQESLQLLEQIGDIQGKAASLSMMAQVYRTRGDLEGALRLYQESLQLLEQIGDIKGKAASLSGLANQYMAREEWDRAEGCLAEALQLSQQLGDPAGVAFDTVKLGQVTQARGDLETARARFQEGLALFQRLGMPRETEQVQQMLTSLVDGEPAASDPLRRALSRARAAAQAGDAAQAVAAQEEAVTLGRQAGEERQALVGLSVLLYNLAGYRQQAGRYDDAVTALEEVVALDERTGHPDLGSDRHALERARQLARLSPEERAQWEAREGALPGDEQDTLDALLQDAQRQLAQMPPEERAQAEAATRELAQRLGQMTAEERRQYLAATQAERQRRRIKELADQARDGAIAALRGETAREPLLERIEQVVARAAEGEAPGSPWDELARYLRDVAALLRGEPLPPVPERYAAHMAAIQDAMRPT